MRDNLLVTYTHSKTMIHSLSVSRQTYSLTLNMNMKAFHIPEVIHGFLLSHLGFDAPESLIEAILTYPDDVLNGKDVTVVFYTQVFHNLSTEWVPGQMNS